LKRRKATKSVPWRSIRETRGAKYKSGAGACDQDTRPLKWVECWRTANEASSRRHFRRRCGQINRVARKHSANRPIPGRSPEPAFFRKFSRAAALLRCFGPPRRFGQSYRHSRRPDIHSAWNGGSGTSQGAFRATLRSRLNFYGSFFSQNVDRDHLVPSRNQQIYLRIVHGKPFDSQFV